MDSVVSSISQNNEIFAEGKELNESSLKMMEGIKRNYPDIYFKVFSHCWKKLGVGFFDDFNVDMIVIPTDPDEVSGFGFKILARCTSFSGGVGASHWEEDIDGIESPLSTGYLFSYDEILDLYEIASGNIYSV